MRQSAYTIKNAGVVDPVPLTPLQIVSGVRAARAAASAQGRSWVDACLVPTPAPKPPGQGLELSAEESARFLCVAAASSAIKRHYDLFVWLNGEVQHFLPHQILISAWGDFASWHIKLDVVSALPGVRTEQLARCRIDPLVRECYTQWVARGREPLMLDAAAWASVHTACTCPLHSALRGMRSLLVHAVRDKRSGNDSLYLALDSESSGDRGCNPRFMSLAQLLFCQVDVACRRVAALPLHDAVAAQSTTLHLLDLSTREREILDCLRRGMTNFEIAAVLDISPFTVKNHVQRIFRKIGASNRTHAAAKYNQAVLESGK
jgi:transcriptional regulator EpsA